MSLIDSWGQWVPTAAVGSFWGAWFRHGLLVRCPRSKRGFMYRLMDDNALQWECQMLRRNSGTWWQWYAMIIANNHEVIVGMSFAKCELRHVIDPMGSDWCRWVHWRCTRYNKYRLEWWRTKMAVDSLSLHNCHQYLHLAPVAPKTMKCFNRPDQIWVIPRKKEGFGCQWWSVYC